MSLPYDPPGPRCGKLIARAPDHTKSIPGPGRNFKSMSTPSKTLDELRADLEVAEKAVLAAGKKGDMDELQTTFTARNRIRTDIARLENEAARIAEEAEKKRVMELTTGLRDKILAVMTSDGGPIVETTKIRTLYVRYDEESQKWRVDVTMPSAARKSTGGTKRGGGGSRRTYNGGKSSREVLQELADAGDEDVIAAFQRIEDAKAAGKFSPGFDSTLKKKISEGKITPDE